MQTLENSVRLGYTHTSVGGRLKWVAGQTGCSIGGERQSSSVHRVSNTGRDRNLFVYHSFDLRGDEANSPRIVKLRLDREYLFDEASLDEQIICSAESCQSPSLHEVVLEFLFFLFFFFFFFLLLLLSLSYRISHHSFVSSMRKRVLLFSIFCPLPNKIYIDRIQIEFETNNIRPSLATAIKHVDDRLIVGQSSLVPAQLRGPSLSFAV